MGGGSSSGKVDYPDYMKAAHEDWLTQSGTDSIEASITECMNDALGASPWAAQLAYDPDVDLAANQASIVTFSAILAGIDEVTDWNTLYANAVTQLGTGGADVTAYAALLDDEINTRILPRFRRGMQDINAVVSSAFPIGEAVIEAFKNRDVAKYAADNRKVYLDAVGQMIQIMFQKTSWNESVMRTTIEANRIKIVAKKEENDVNMEIDKDDALWDLEVFQYGANLLAGIAGGTAGASKPSKAASAIGGAMSMAGTGASIGGAVGGPLGAGIGGAIGGAVGLIGGLFS